jgi:hypothetical protein
LSEIRANTISNAAGTGPIDLYKQSAAKVWARYDGASVIVESFNVSSTVDLGTAGATTVNITNAFDSSGYAVQGTCNGTSGDMFVTVSQINSTYYIAYTWDGAVRTDGAVGTIATGDLA